MKVCVRVPVGVTWSLNRYVSRNRHLQAAVYRTTLDKTFRFHGKYDVVSQNDSMPISVSAVPSVEGADNFQERRAPAVGVVASRTFVDKVAVYAAPMGCTIQRRW